MGDRLGIPGVLGLLIFLLARVLIINSYIVVLKEVVILLLLHQNKTAHQHYVHVIVV